MRAKMISAVQERICLIIYKHTVENGYAPTIREIGLAMDFVSVGGKVNTSHIEHHLGRLEDMGYLWRECHTARSTRLTELGSRHVERVIGSVRKEQRQRGGIPLLGKTAAGKPRSLCSDEGTMLDLWQGLDSERVYALQVEGESMIEEHICDGDFVIVQVQDEYKSGDIVVVMCTGPKEETVTLKRLYRDKHEVQLRPANARMSPIVIGAEEWARSWCIQGRVVRVERRVGRERIKAAKPFVV